MIKKLIVLLILSLPIGAWAGFQALQHYLNAPRTLSEPVTIVISSGTSFRFVAGELAKKDVISHPQILSWYARFKGLSHKIQAGEYRFMGVISPQSVLDQLLAGEIVYHFVTFVEGERWPNFLQSLWAQSNIKVTLADKSEQEILSALNADIEHLEGLLFPDTYRYIDSDTDFSIVERAYRRMQDVLAEEWENRSEGLPYQSSYDALVMASIVEKETGVAAERPQIAGVFVRRLQKKMRLQTDPTVIYGLGPEFDGNLTRQHLRQATPYNTYVISGLPPTPIAAPGRAAINAALHPAPGNSLYFVARGDGSHEFTSSLSEHNKAVDKYQRRRVKNYRSAPANN